MIMFDALCVFMFVFDFVHFVCLYVIKTQVSSK